jgi:hypothetical protein
MLVDEVDRAGNRPEVEVESSNRCRLGGMAGVDNREAFLAGEDPLDELDVEVGDI